MGQTDGSRYSKTPPYGGGMITLLTPTVVTLRTLSIYRQ